MTEVQPEENWVRVRVRNAADARPNLPEHVPAILETLLAREFVEQTLPGKKLVDIAGQLLADPRTEAPQ